jgi:prepilin-type N-terminal cleavage/methylation domain-containing protein
MKCSSPSPRGFTLIELLVVIAIIGILSSVILAALNTARTKGDDALREENTKSLETALELYYNSNGTYPELNNVPDAGWAVSGLSTFLVPNDIASIPVDPTPGTTDQYVWDANGQAYGLFVYTAKNINNTAGGYCITGVNVNPGWYGGVGVVPACNF